MKADFFRNTPRGVIFVYSTRSFKIFNNLPRAEGRRLQALDTSLPASSGASCQASSGKIHIHKYAAVTVPPIERQQPRFPGFSPAAKAPACRCGCFPPPLRLFKYSAGTQFSYKPRKVMVAHARLPAFIAVKSPGSMPSSTYRRFPAPRTPLRQAASCVSKRPLDRQYFSQAPIRTAVLTDVGVRVGDRNRHAFRKPRFSAISLVGVSGARIIADKPSVRFLVYHMFEPRIKRRKKIIRRSSRPFMPDGLISTAMHALRFRAESAAERSNPPLR